MTPEEAIKELISLQHENPDDDMDTENVHIRADEILCELVPPEVAHEWHKVKKWYS